MRLHEFTTDGAGYYSPDQDKYNQQQLTDVSRPHITLRHLNQMKKMRAAKDLENLIRKDVLSLMYGTPSTETGGGGGAPPGF